MTCFHRKVVFPLSNIVGICQEERDAFRRSVLENGGKVVNIMADDIKVSPTPIQRNPLDVATELTQLYSQFASFKSVEDMQEIFLKFFAVAKTANIRGYDDLKQYLPKEYREIIESRR